MRALRPLLARALLAGAARAAGAATLPPDTPQGLSGAFRFAGAGAKPSLDLGWEPSFPRSYLLLGYRIYRREGGVSGTATTLGSTDRGPWQDNHYSDSEQLDMGKAYAYQVQAVDAKGNSSGMSAPCAFDLATVPSEQVAPLPPKGLTARAGRSSLRLAWQPSMGRASALSDYLVFRATGAATLPKLARPLTITSATEVDDTPPAEAQPYTYVVCARDIQGRISSASLTLTTGATGTLPPAPPSKFTALAGEIRVDLSWQAAEPGTAPVSAYLVTRYAPDAKPHDFLPIPAAVSKTSYTLGDGDLDAKALYRYSVRTQDLEGNTSEAVYVAAFTLPERLDKSNVILMPTAYSSDQEHDLGVNLNVAFSYFIGALYESYDDPVSERTKINFFQPVRIGTFSIDVKDCFYPDHELLPGLAAGYYTMALINTSQPASGSSQQAGVSSSGNSQTFDTMGGAYLVGSKRLGQWATLHAGAMLGNLANDVTGAAPQAWGPTLRHMLPGDNIPDLFPQLIDSGLSVSGTAQATTPYLGYVGFQAPFSLPLGFTTWHSAMRAEFISPIPDGKESWLPWMVNLHFDHLPLFGFEFSYFHFYQGYQVLAFYHFHDLNWTF